MKLAQFRYMDENRIGVALGDSLIVDVHEAAAGLRLPFNFPYTMREFIDFDTVALETVRFLLYQCERYPHRIKPIPLTEIEWLPPIHRPGKIVCVGPNDGESSGVSFWLKASSSLIGHNQPIELTASLGPIYPEPRLAVVIGKRASHIEAEGALKFVYGYTILNDIAGQPDTPPLVRSNDTFGPMGPWLVTKNEVVNPNALEGVCTLGKQTVAHFNVSPIPLKIEEIISTVSIYQTLEPGDIICLGQGGRSSDTDLQLVTDPLEITVSKIGRLSNPVQHN